jgi:hypothetical protein
MGKRQSGVIRDKRPSREGRLHAEQKTNKEKYRGTAERDPGGQTHAKSLKDFFGSELVLKKPS